MRILAHLKLSLLSSVKLFILSVMSWKYCLRKKPKMGRQKNWGPIAPKLSVSRPLPNCGLPFPPSPAETSIDHWKAGFPPTSAHCTLINQCTLHSDQPVHISIEHPLNRCILHCTSSQPVHFTLCTLYNQCTMYGDQEKVKWRWALFEGKHNAMNSFSPWMYKTCIAWSYWCLKVCFLSVYATFRFSSNDSKKLEIGDIGCNTLNQCFPKWPALHLWWQATIQNGQHTVSSEDNIFFANAWSFYHNALMINYIHNIMHSGQACVCKWMWNVKYNKWTQSVID